MGRRERLCQRRTQSNQELGEALQKPERSCLFIARSLTLLLEFEQPPPEGCRRERSRALQDNLTSEHEVVQAAVSSGPQSKHRPRTKDVDDGIAGGAASQCPQEW